MTEDAPKPACRACKDTGVVTIYEAHDEFNPGSPKQTLALMHALGIKPPKKRGRGTETTESKYLRRLGERTIRGKQPYAVLKTIYKWRERSKLMGTFLWGLQEVRETPEGPLFVFSDEPRAKTTYGWNPSTWRKSSRQVNLQNIPTRTDLGQELRETIVAPPGEVLLEVDAESIEAVLMGYIIGDFDYIRTAKAGLHAWFMSHVLGSPVDVSQPFPQLKAALKKLKKENRELYDRCKRTIHGTNYGLTPFGMHDEYEEEFPEMSIAEEMQNRYFALCPKLRAGFDSLRQRAYKETFLDNHFGYRHWFYDVFTWNNAYQRWELGEDGKRCIAFIPQSDASAIQTEDLLVMTETDEAEAAGPLVEFDPKMVTELRRFIRLIIHDSFVFQLPKDDVQWVAEAACGVMTRPRSELGGLTIGAEPKAGTDLKNTSTVAVKASAAPNEQDLAGNRVISVSQSL